MTHDTHVAAGHLGLGRGAPHGGGGGGAPSAGADPIHFAVISAAVTQLGPIFSIPCLELKSKMIGLI